MAATKVIRIKFVMKILNRINSLILFKELLILLAIINFNLKTLIAMEIVRKLYLKIWLLM